MNHDPERLKRVARIVRNQHGIEMVPAEVGETMDSAIATIRAEMVRAGHPEFAAMSDHEVREAYRDAMACDDADPETWSDEDCDRIMAEYANEPDPSTPEEREAMWQSFRKFAGWDKDDEKKERT